MRKSFLRSFLAVAGLLAMTLGLLASGATSAAAKTSQVPRAKVAPSIFWLEQGAGNPYWNAEHLAAAQLQEARLHLQSLQRQPERLTRRRSSSSWPPSTRA